MKLVLLIVGSLYMHVALAQTPEEKIQQLGYELFTPPAPSANFVKAVTTGNLVFLAGHGPEKPMAPASKAGWAMTYQSSKATRLPEYRPLLYYHR